MSVSALLSEDASSAPARVGGISFGAAACNRRTRPVWTEGQRLHAYQGACSSRRPGAGTCLSLPRTGLAYLPSASQQRMSTRVRPLLSRLCRPATSAAASSPHFRGVRQISYSVPEQRHRLNEGIAMTGLVSACFLCVACALQRNLAVPSEALRNGCAQTKSLAVSRAYRCSSSWTLRPCGDSQYRPDCTPTLRLGTVPRMTTTG